MSYNINSIISGSLKSCVRVQSINQAFSLISKNIVEQLSIRLNAYKNYISKRNSSSLDSFPRACWVLPLPNDFAALTAFHSLHSGSLSFLFISYQSLTTSQHKAFFLKQTFPHCCYYSLTALQSSILAVFMLERPFG